MLLDLNHQVATTPLALSVGCSIGKVGCLDAADCLPPVQCFYGVSELRNAVSSYVLAPGGGGGSSTGGGAQAAASHRLAVAARDLFKDLQRSAQPVPPLAFWLGLREAYPQFNQQNNQARLLTLLRSS